ncbi:N-substituted formamide deformylase [Nocardiopsis dassonvillei]|uniref:amidohydrolase n=1 Tax=Nocardiopsis dassonvillei TaxID=2014 RepID=UPI003F575557
MTNILIRDGVLFSGGRLLDATALAVRDGRIAAVGTEEEARAAAGPGARTVDAAGGLVTPGFADAHVHACFGGVEAARCDLTGADSAQECLDAVRAYADSHPDTPGGWVLGGGWAMSWFSGGTPAKDLLDAVVPDRPVFLINADHHGAWANSRALALAGVDARTPDPADGRIERDADGTPSGTLHEGAMDLVGRLVPATTAEECGAGILTAQEYLLSLGVTAWHEAIVGDYAGYPDIAPAYRALAAAGRLHARVTGAVWVPRDLTPDGVDAFVADLRVRREEGGPGLRLDTAKIMVDGVAENRTAALHDPYLAPCGCGGPERGLAYFGPDLLDALVPALNAAGIAAHFHAIGDRAVTTALDSVARVEPGHRAAVRNHLAHLQVVDPRDVPRFRELGVTVNMQALWACNEEQMTELTLPLLGPERARWQYPFGSLAADGAELAMGSDWPVSTPDPWQALHVAATRRAPGDAGSPPLEAGEALPLARALEAYTAGSHRLLGFGDAGLLEAGRRADLCVADRDPFAGPPEDVHLTRNRLTVLGGRIVHGG